MSTARERLGELGLELPPMTPPLAAYIPAVQTGNHVYVSGQLPRGNDGALLATPFQKQDSSMLATLAHADCLVVRAPLAPPAQAGDRVEIVPFPGGTGGV